VTVAVLVAEKTGETVYEAVTERVGVGVDVALGTGLGTFDPVCVIVGVIVPVSSGGTHEASVTSGEIYETMSRLGPPSAVSAMIVILFLPCVRSTVTDDVLQIFHAPVDGNKSVCAWTTPFTDTCMSLEFALAFAYLYVRVSACAEPASTKNMTDAPVLLFRFA